jgi:hypothetical protein
VATKTRPSILGVFLRWCVTSGKAWSLLSEFFFFFFWGLLFNWPRKTLVKMLNEYPLVYSFRADTWARLIELWNQHCAEHHNHEDSPPSSPPPSPSPVKTAAPTTPRKGRKAAGQNAPSAASISAPALRAPRYGKVVLPRAPPAPAILRLSKEELEHLAAFKPPPVTLSPQRANQLFGRVLGADAIIEEGHVLSPPAFSDGRNLRAQTIVHADAREPMHTAPMLYAVSGHKRIFQDR